MKPPPNRVMARHPVKTRLFDEKTRMTELILARDRRRPLPAPRHESTGDRVKRRLRLQRGAAFNARPGPTDPGYAARTNRRGRRSRGGGASRWREDVGSWLSTSARALSSSTSSGSPPKYWKAPSSPSNHADCRS